MASKWFYSQGGVRRGPVSSSELRQLAREGALKPQDLLWKEGMAEWLPASKTQGLFPEASKAEPSSAPPLPSTDVPPSRIVNNGRGVGGTRLAGIGCLTLVVVASLAGVLATKQRRPQQRDPSVAEQQAAEENWVKEGRPGGRLASAADHPPLVKTAIEQRKEVWWLQNDTKDDLVLGIQSLYFIFSGDHLEHVVEKQRGFKIGSRVDHYWRSFPEGLSSDNNSDQKIDRTIQWNVSKLTGQLTGARRVSSKYEINANALLYVTDSLKITAKWNADGDECSWDSYSETHERSVVRGKESLGNKSNACTGFGKRLSP